MGRLKSSSNSHPFKMSYKTKVNIVPSIITYNKSDMWKQHTWNTFRKLISLRGKNDKRTDPNTGVNVLRLTCLKSISVPLSPHITSQTHTHTVCFSTQNKWESDPVCSGCHSNILDLFICICVAKPVGVGPLLFKRAQNHVDDSCFSYNECNIQ